MNIQYQRKSDMAVIPTRAHPSDIGLDLSIISFVKNLTHTTALFDTGLIVKPPDGYYIEIVGRSSISKSLWMVANSIGIIDPNYRDTLKVALEYKNNIDVEDMMTEIENTEFPYKCCQIILRKAEYADMVETDFSVDTDRGLGGFGSTDK